MPRARPSIDKQFQAEDDMRTLRRAEEVKASPTRMKAAQQEAKKEVQALTKVSKGGKAKK